MRPAGKIERALGANLGLKPHRCNSPKCPYLRRQSRPGAHGRSHRRALSEYGRELLEKQRLRFSYQLDERVLRRYVEKAKKGGKEAHAELVSLLERRLDTVLARSGLAASRREARVCIRHGHFLLNGKGVRSPGLLVSPGDVVTLRSSSQELALFRERAKDLTSHEPPGWLSVETSPLILKVERLPAAEELGSVPYDTRLVVEYYSR